MDLNQRCLKLGLALLIQGVLCHGIVGLCCNICIHGLFTCYLVDSFIEDLVTKLKHLHEFKRDEVISRHASGLVNVYFPVVFDCGLH